MGMIIFYILRVSLKVVIVFVILFEFVKGIFECFRWLLFLRSAIYIAGMVWVMLSIEVLIHLAARQFIDAVVINMNFFWNANSLSVNTVTVNCFRYVLR